MVIGVARLLAAAGAGSAQVVMVLVVIVMLIVLLCLGMWQGLVVCHLDALCSGEYPG